ncbi:hypothetical protein MBBAR_10c00790 [Methanobrevibacter arboriphilus JCM 13429 = DSM 1125]|uniref:Uncharacterized protein n=1 Tax=Methanobrevibacter arboriphilus JCM 13429 = DSM 1125 TaxID=1300164 RepID=A0A1V6N212_METAZ|nr:hypothetical protein [Methanobrevibacter arboriphilus]OQD58738.1 hypothetical protein MBBAR_10c00790 [Methanobrevibacter arboriphilus JCM 13429 = DSM 1125]
MSETIEKLKEKWDTLVEIGWVESISKDGDVKLNPSASMKADNGEYINRKTLEQMFKEVFLFIGDYMLKTYNDSFYSHRGYF